MPQYVEFNGDVIEFPDDMSDDEISAVLSKQTGTPEPATPPVQQEAQPTGDVAADPEAAMFANQAPTPESTMPSVMPEPRSGSFVKDLFADFGSANELASQIQKSNPVFNAADRFQSGVAKSMAAPFIGGAQLVGETANLAGADFNTQGMVKAADELLGDSSGVAGKAGEVIGAVLNPLYRAIGNRLGLPASTTGQAIGKGAATGATAAALNPIQSEEYWAQKGLEVAAGGATGGALGAAFGKEVVNSRLAVDKAFKESSAAIQAVKDQGIKFSRAVTFKVDQNIKVAIGADITDGLKNPKLGQVRTALKNFKAKAERTDGDLMVFEELKRDAAAIINNSKAPNEAKKAAYAIRNVVDDLFANVDERSIKSGTKEGIKMLIEGRAASRAAHRANEIQKVMDNAQRAAASRKNLSYPKALAAQLEKLAAKPDEVLLKNFTAEEIKQLRKLSKGGMWDKAEGLLASLSDMRAWLAAAGSAPVTSGSTLVIPVAAAAGKRAANRLAGSVREAGLQGMISDIMAP